MIVPLVAATALGAAASALGRYAAPTPGGADAGITVRMPSHACECGTPNIRDFPRAGAFVFVWEYPAPSSRDRPRRFPRRPAYFRVAQQNPHSYECPGPSWGTDFRHARRVFQVEVYPGPAAGRHAREQVDALLDSFHARPARRHVPG